MTSDRIRPSPDLRDGDDTPSNPARRHWVGAGAILAAAGLVHPHAALAQQSSNVASAQGDVLVNGMPLGRSQTIETGDRITTGPSGRVLFSIGDSAFQVRPDSELVVERSKLFVVGGLRLLTGAVVAVFGHGPHRQVSTPSATIGIRGTGIYCEANAQDTYFCTCYGATELNAGISHESVVASRHVARRLGDTMQGRGAIMIAPEVNHQNDELSELEHLVGRETPWAKAAQG